MQRIARNSMKLGLPALIWLSATAGRADTPPYVRIRSISYAGTGCPAGSVAENVAPDLQAFTLLFDNYVAQTGPGIPFSEKRKNCQLNIALDFPQGWTFTLVTVDYRGYVTLDPGVTAIQQSSYYFQGQPATARLRSTMFGPLDEDYQARDVLGMSALVWAPCGAQRSLNINTEVRTDNSFNPNGQGMITTDSIDGGLKQIYGFQWRQCY